MCLHLGAGYPGTFGKVLALFFVSSGCKVLFYYNTHSFATFLPPDLRYLCNSFRSWVQPPL